MNLFWALSCYFFFGIAQNMLYILLPLYAGAAGYLSGMIGLIAAVPNLFSLFIDILCGSVSDSVGRKPMLKIGCAALTAAGFLLFLSKRFFALIPALIFFGIANSAFISSMLAAVSEISSGKDMVKAQSINGAMQALSAMAGAFLSGRLFDILGDKVSFLPVCFFSCLAYMLCAKLQIPYVPSDSGIGSVKKKLQLSAEVAKSPLVMTGILLTVLYSISVYALGNTYFPLFALKKMNLSASGAGYLLSFRNLVAMAGSLLFIPVVRRFNYFSMTVVVQFTGALSVLLMPFSGSRPVIILLLILQGLSLGYIPAGNNISVYKGSPGALHGTAFAIIGLVSRIISLAFPLILGFMADRIDLSFTFVFSGICMTAAVGALLHIMRRNRLEKQNIFEP